MKKIALLSLAASSILCAAAVFKIQEEVFSTSTSYTIPQLNKGDYLSTKFPQVNNIDGFEVSGSSIRIYSKSNRRGMVAYGAGVSSGYKYSPVFYVSTFDLNTGAANLETYPIHLMDVNGKDKYSITDAVTLSNAGNQDTDFHLSDLKAKYPKAFEQAVASPITTPYNMTIQPGFSGYKLLLNNSVKSQDVTGNLTVSYTSSYPTAEMPAFEGEHKLSSWGVEVFNKKDFLLTTIVGANRKDLKNNFYKEISFVTYNNTGKITGETRMKFDFTKDAHYFELVDNVDNNSKQTVAILGNRMMLGKQNDPDNTKYTLVALNTDGTQMLTKDFNVGAKAIDFNPVHSFIKDDKVYIVSRNNSAVALETYIFDKSGNVTKNSISASELNAITTGSKELGHKFVAGAPTIKQIGAYKLSNGNTLIVSEHMTMDEVKNPDPAAVGTLNATIKVPRYRSVHSLEVNAEGKVLWQFAQSKEFSNVNAPMTIEKALVAGDKVIFLTVDQIAATKTNAKQLLAYNVQYQQLGSPETCKPVVFIFDAGSDNAAITKPSDASFVTLYGTGSFISSPNNQDVCYVGMKNTSDMSKQEFAVVKFKF